MASGYSFNIIVINWTKVATKCRDNPNQHGPRDTLVRKLPDVGRHIAYLLMRLMLDHNYAAFNIELVTDNIGAHIAHESMLSHFLSHFLHLQPEHSFYVFFSLNNLQIDFIGSK